MEYHLLTFLAVCQEMNYTRAAEQLHITQPAVSQQIRWLEREYGAPLFGMQGKRLYLTPAGELLRRAATTQQADDAVLRRRMLAAGADRQLLQLGATRTIGESFIGRSLAAYLRRHPALELNLQVQNNEALLQGILAGELQCALVEGYFDPARFEAETFCTEPYIAVCAAQRSFAAPPRTVRDLLGEPLLLREQGSGTREIFEKFLAVESLRVQNFAQVLHIGSLQVILRLLEEDIGISFLYQTAVQAALDTGTLRVIPLERMPLQHDFTMVWQRGSRYGQEYRSLCRELRVLAGRG